jgi:polyhydroxybutyrate depolymerase
VSALTHVNDLADQQGADDVAFYRQLIATLQEHYSVDSQRISITGISNGGLMTQRLACELADRIAAVVSVAAMLSTNLAATCAPSRPR